MQYPGFFVWTYNSETLKKNPKQKFILTLKGEK